MQVRSRVRSVFISLWAGLAVTGAGLVAGAGCTSSRVIRHDDLRPGDSYARSVVFLQSGAQYQFSRVAVYPDTVIGEYQVTVARSSAEGGATPLGGAPGTGAVYYEEETHAHRMALAAVESLAVVRRDPQKTLLFAAGALGAGFVIFKGIDSKNAGGGD